jgi:PAS domain S-box-containing protein
MDKKNKKNIYKILLYTLPIIILLVSFFSWYRFNEIIKIQERERFENSISELFFHLDENKNSIEDALKLISEFFAASDNVTQDEWNIFSKHVYEHYNASGINAIEFIEHIDDSNNIIKFITPLDGNEKALGFNLSSEENRNSAIKNSVLNNSFSITDPVELVQDQFKDRNAILAVYPIYKGSERVELHGYSLVILDVANYVENSIEKSSIDYILGNNLLMQIYDSNNYNLIYESDELMGRLGFDNFERTLFNFEIGDKNWEIIIYLEPVKLGIFKSISYINLLLVLGILLAVLIFFLLRNIIINRIILKQNIIKVSNENKVKTQKLKELLEKSNESNIKLKQQKDDLVNLKDATLNILEDIQTQSEELKRFKQAVDSSTDAMVITDKDAKILYANDVWCKLNEYKKENVIGKNPKILNSNKTPKKIYKKMWENLSMGKHFYSDEVINKKKSGELYNAQLSIYPIVGENEQSKYYVGIQRDITKDKAVDKAKTEFVSLASHQLRTPLSAIGWYAELLEDDKKLSKKQKEFVHEIRSGQKRMTDLVSALLNTSRLELGTFKIDVKEVKPVSILRSLLDELKPKIDEKNLKIIENHEDNIVMKSDVGLVRIIFQNIITNSVKYTNVNDEIKIDLNTHKKGEEFRGKKLKQDMLCCVISDNGIGIPKEQQSEIFNKLFRADNVKIKQTEGTGLGLYLVKEILHVLGGEIWFESEPDIKTTFYIMIPMVSKPKDGRTMLEM